MSTSYSETLKWSPDWKEDSGFYISRTRTGSMSEERFPLSHWHLSKEVTVQIVLMRVVENIDINQGLQRKIFYVQDLTYKIESKLGKDYYLRLEKQKEFEDRFNKVLAKVYLQNVNRGFTSEAPLPNTLFNTSSMPFLTIEKGKATRLKKGELEPLLKNGSLMVINTG